nr:[FeFe] hydrogenase H-cluster radical SAM maturase HydE [uncultured Aminipila sp.]
MKKIIDKLYLERRLEPLEFRKLLEIEENQRYDFEEKDKISTYLFEKARKVRQEHYGNKVFTRGLIELTNYCKNDCYYCGIRRSNSNVFRYRLEKGDILSCCETGYSLGFRTFVLQGGEDRYYTDKIMTDIIYTIKSQYPDCAVTLSLGEKEYETYKAYFDAGADRYLLRHETSNPEHYRKLHPGEMSLSHRKKCLEELKGIGFQVGCGIMVGSPFQTIDNLVEDLIYMKELSPHMVGIGPFIRHHDTPFAKENSGTMEQTLFLLGLIRLMLPKVLLPATTALGTINPKGRELGILAGANVVMPNLSPLKVRKNYELYDNKICTGDEAAECRQCMDLRMKSIGYEIVVERGDFKK